MKKLAVLFALLCASAAHAQFVPYTQAAQHHGGGAGTISFRGGVTYDSGAVTTTPALALPVTANAGDLIFIGAPTGGNTSVVSICDAPTNAACTVSASTYTTSGLTQCQGGSGPCTVGAWTCNAAAGVNFVTVTRTGADDENITIAVVAHTVTSSCLDAHPTPVNSASVGSTIISNAFSTAVANEIAFYIFSDDNNCGPNWTGTHGTGYTLITVASSCTSMLGAGEYKIFTTLQTSVTASFTTGNSAGNPIATDLFTFE